MDGQQQVAVTSRSKTSRATGALTSMRRLLGRARRDLAWRLEARVRALVGGAGASASRHPSAADVGPVTTGPEAGLVLVPMASQAPCLRVSDRSPSTPLTWQAWRRSHVTRQRSPGPAGAHQDRLVARAGSRMAGSLGPIRGAFRMDVRLPHTGNGRVQVRIELQAHRPIREAIAAVIEVLAPAATLPYTQSASVGSNAGLPGWLPVAADAAMHFVGSPLDPFEDGAPVDVVSGRMRGPDDPPPNRAAADAELLLDHSPAHGFGEAPTEAVGVTRHQVVVQGADIPRVLLDAHGRGGRRWTAPAASSTSAGAHGRLQLRVTDVGLRWRYAGSIADTNDLDDRAGGGSWLGLDAQPQATDLPKATAWWSVVPRSGTACRLPTQPSWCSGRR